MHVVIEVLLPLFAKLFLEWLDSLTQSGRNDSILVFAM